MPNLEATALCDRPPLTASITLTLLHRLSTFHDCFEGVPDDSGAVCFNDMMLTNSTLRKLILVAFGPLFIVKNSSQN